MVMPHSRHGPHGALGVAVAHQCLADEDDVGALADAASTSAGPKMPDSATVTTVVGEQRREPAERVGVDLEGLQVAGVDADQLGAELDGPRGLGLVVHLDQGGEPERARSAYRRCSSSPGSAATISRARSAPAARASSSW